MFTGRMQHKLTQTTQHALAVTVVCCAAAGFAVWLVMSERLHRPMGMSGDDLRAMVLPGVFLLFGMCLTAGGLLWYMHRKQMFIRVSGLRKDRAADLLLPTYTTGTLVRAWLLLVPALAGLLALMATGEAMLAGMPVVCAVLNLINIPSKGRFERFVEAGISAQV
jgi:hypothetical protein